MENLHLKLDALMSALILSNTFWANVYHTSYAVLSYTAVVFGVILGGHAIWRLIKTGHNSYYNTGDPHHDEGDHHV